MGVASLTKVTVIAPRTDYQQVLKRLSKFHDFHLIEDRSFKFDQVTEGLAVRSVRLFAQVDQIVKDLSIPLNPAMIDVLFKGESIEQTEYQADGWANLVDKTETEFEPVRNEIRSELTRYSQAMKGEAETRILVGSIQAYSNISAEVGRLNELKRLHAALTISPNESLAELQRSLPDAMFVTQPVDQTHTMVLVVSPRDDSDKVDKVLKTLDLKPFNLPEGLPKNPAEAYERLNADLSRFIAERTNSEAKLELLKEKYAQKLLAIRELAEHSHKILDETRKAGGFQRLATISGYIPTSGEAVFAGEFQNWIFYTERVRSGERGIPTLMRNAGPGKTFELITKEQGIPGGHEVDPTPIVTFVFPVFFGFMFGDLGHGLVLTLFALLLRARGIGNVRQWGNLFLTAGIAAMVSGALFGEFFGFSTSQVLHIPAALEIVVRPPVVQQATLNSSATLFLLVVSIFIGIAHLITGMSLDIVQAVRGHETVELLTHKVPMLIMYISGIGFGFAFIGAGYSFNVLSTAKPVPLLGVPTSTLGAISLTVVFASMIVLAVGRGVAIVAGRITGEGVGSAIANGGIEVFEAISRFLANTISYVRLAIMLFVHAALLITVNMFLVFPLYISAVPIVIFNILIVVFEVLIVYIQDLRLHIYEFFTKFYDGTGTPFVRLFPDRVRIRIKWV